MRPPIASLAEGVDRIYWKVGRKWEIAWRGGGGEGRCGDDRWRLRVSIEPRMELRWAIRPDGASLLSAVCLVVWFQCEKVWTEFTMQGILYNTPSIQRGIHKCLGREQFT